MRREQIVMPYIGSCLSVNHRLGRRKDGGYYVKPEVKDWQEEYMWLLKRLHLEDWTLPLEVTCSATFTSEHRACDLVNFQKVVLDPIEDLTGINDSNCRWRDGDRDIDPKQTPHLLITIAELVPSPIQQALQSTPVPPNVESNIIPRTKRKYVKKSH